MNQSGAATTEALGYSEVLSPYVGVFVVAWLVTILATPVMRLIAVRRGIVDWPDLDRKRHLEPVAYLGGVAIFLGWLAGILVCLSVTPHLPAHFSVRRVDFPLSIIFGAVIITAVGLIDDINRISPRVKLGGQLIAAAMIAHTDLGTTFVERLLGAMGVPDPELLGPFTVSYVLGAVTVAVMTVGSCNAVNLLDGLDGLVAGVLAICCLGFLVIACQGAIDLSNAQTQPASMDLVTDPVRLVMCLAILGALLGFLPHNFNPASIFMGDAGSLLLGYLCATTIMLFAHSPQRGPLLVMATLVVFALPITDTALAIFRRVMARQPVFTGDSQHIHHQLAGTFRNLGCGPNLTVKLAVCTMYLLAAVFAALGCLMVFMRWRFVTAVFAVIFGFVMVVGYKAGRHQMLLRRLSPGAAPADPAVRQGDQGPQAAGPPADARCDAADPRASPPGRPDTPPLQTPPRPLQ